MRIHNFVKNNDRNYPRKVRSSSFFLTKVEILTVFRTLPIFPREQERNTTHYHFVDESRAILGPRDVSARAPLKRGRGGENKENETSQDAWIEMPSSSSSTKGQPSYAQVARTTQPKKEGGKVPPKGPPKAPQKGRKTKVGRNGKKGGKKGKGKK